MLFHTKTLLTIGVGIAGLLTGGFGAAFFGFGSSAPFNSYGLLVAILGASLAFTGCRWTIDP